MAKTVELFFSIQNGQPSICFHIADTVEGDAKAKIQEMLNDLPEPVTNSLKNLPPARLLPCNEIEVQEVSFALPPAQGDSLPSNGSCPIPQGNTANSNTNGSSSSRAKITAPQIAIIRRNLRERGIPEYIFCKKHQVKRIEDLPGGVAWHIIHDNNF